MRAKSPYLLLLLLSVSVYGAADREAARATVILPVVGDVRGAFGTFWQTEVTLSNGKNVPQRVQLFWLPNGSSGNPSEPVAELTLPAGLPVVYQNFVETILLRSGLGSVIVRGVDASGAFDPQARVDAYARIFTRMPSSEATVSQGVYASTLYTPGTDDFGEITARAMGLRQDSQFRTNVGLINADDVSLNFTVTVRSEREILTVIGPIAIPPFSMQQFALPPVSYGTFAVDVIASPQIPELAPSWMAYATTVDNRSGSAWYSKAQALMVRPGT